MLADIALRIVQHDGVIGYLIAVGVRFLLRQGQYLVLTHGVQTVPKRIKVVDALLVLRHFLRQDSRSACLTSEIPLLQQFTTLLMAPFVGYHAHGVNRLVEPCEILAHMLIRQNGLVITAEIRGKIYQYPLVREGLSSVRNTLRRTGGALLLRVEVLKRLALRQIQDQIPFVLTRCQMPSIRYHHFRIIETARVVIDHHVQ